MRERLTLGNILTIVGFIIVIGGAIIAFASKTAVMGEDIEDLQDAQVENERVFEQGIKSIKRDMQKQTQYQYQLNLWYMQARQAEARGDPMPAPPTPPAIGDP
jgi:hypothetical protein